jgi:hypothetical protein
MGSWAAIGLRTSIARVGVLTAAVRTNGVCKLGRVTAAARTAADSAAVTAEPTSMTPGLGFPAETGMTPDNSAPLAGGGILSTITTTIIIPPPSN